VVRQVHEGKGAAGVSKLMFAGGTWDEAWIVYGVQRTKGRSAGRVDYRYIAPDGKKLRQMRDVYSYLGLTAAAPRPTAPHPSTTQVAEANAVATTNGRGVREATLSASVAITGKMSDSSPVRQSCSVRLAPERMQPTTLCQS
jgi:hypothetical protein